MKKKRQKNYERYFKAFTLRYVNGLKLEAVAKELGVSIERARLVSGWVKYELNNPSCINQKVLEFKKTLPKEALERIKES